MLIAGTANNASAQNPWGGKVGKQHKGKVVFTSGAEFKSFNASSLEMDKIKGEIKLGESIDYIAFFNSAKEKLEKWDWAVWVDEQRVKVTLNPNSGGYGWLDACFSNGVFTSSEKYVYINNKVSWSSRTKQSGSSNLQDIFPFLKRGSTHKIKVAIIKTKYLLGNEKLPEEAIYCSGEFDLVCSESAYDEINKKYKLGFDKDNAASLAKRKSFENFDPPMKDKDLEEAMLKAIKSYASSHGWKENFTQVKIKDEDWTVSRNKITSVILGRRISTFCYAVWPDGHCTSQIFSFYEEYDGSKYVRSKLYRYSTGAQTKIDCLGQ